MQNETSEGLAVDLLTREEVATSWQDLPKVKTQIALTSTPRALTPVVEAVEHLEVLSKYDEYEPSTHPLTPYKRTVTFRVPIHPSMRKATQPYNQLELSMSIKVPVEEITEAELDDPDGWTIEIDTKQVFYRALPLAFKFIRGSQNFPHLWRIMVAGSILGTIVPRAVVRLSFGCHSRSGTEPGVLSCYVDWEWRSLNAIFHVDNKPAILLRPESPVDIDFPSSSSLESQEA